MKKESIEEKILKVAIKGFAFKKLHDVEEEACNLIREIELSDHEEAKLKILKIIIESCDEFCNEMKTRIKNSSS